MKQLVASALWLGLMGPACGHIDAVGGNRIVARQVIPQPVQPVPQPYQQPPPQGYQQPPPLPYQQPQPLPYQQQPPPLPYQQPPPQTYPPPQAYPPPQVYPPPQAYPPPKGQEYPPALIEPSPPPVTTMPVAQPSQRPIAPPQPEPPLRSPPPASVVPPSLAPVPSTIAVGGPPGGGPPGVTITPPGGPNPPAPSGSSRPPAQPSPPAGATKTPPAAGPSPGPPAPAPGTPTAGAKLGCATAGDLPSLADCRNAVQALAKDASILCHPVDGEVWITAGNCSISTYPFMPGVPPCSGYSKQEVLLAAQNIVNSCQAKMPPKLAGFMTGEMEIKPGSGVTVRVWPSCADGPEDRCIHYPPLDGKLFGYSLL